MLQVTAPASTLALAWVLRAAYRGFALLSVLFLPADLLPQSLGSPQWSRLHLLRLLRPQTQDAVRPVWFAEYARFSIKGSTLLQFFFK